jgi:hypothetical protein
MEAGKDIGILLAPFSLVGGTAFLLQLARFRVT